MCVSIYVFEILNAVGFMQCVCEFDINKGYSRTETDIMKHSYGVTMVL